MAQPGSRISAEPATPSTDGALRHDTYIYECRNVIDLTSRERRSGKNTALFVNGRCKRGRVPARMEPMRILHLEDNPHDSVFVERGIERQGIAATFTQARSREEFSEALRGGSYDIVLVDNGLPGFNARDAITLSKSNHPHVPVIVCSGAARDADVEASFAAGASDYVLKDYSWQLAAALRRLSMTQPDQFAARRAGWMPSSKSSGTPPAS
jgi:CheY-like chemotaxis protein